MEVLQPKRPLSLSDSEIIVGRARPGLAIQTSLHSGGSDDSKEECEAAGRLWRACGNFACEEGSGVCYDKGSGDWDT